MPSVSRAQYKIMEIASYNKKFAEERNMDQKKAREWHEEDKKKREEDPEWYKKLPEKAPDKKEEKKDVPKKKKKGKSSNEAYSPSFEGILSRMASIFGAKPKKANTPAGTSESKLDEYSRVMKEFKISEMVRNPNMETLVTLNTGVIPCKDVAQMLHLKQWGNNWLSQLETTVKSYIQQMDSALKKRATYTKNLERIYKHCETLKPKEALEYATAKVAEEKRKVGGPPKISLPLTSLAIEPGSYGGIEYVFGHINPPAVMDVPDHAALKKIVSLIELTWKSYDDGEDDESWCLDDTDEVKWWDYHYPDEDKYWSPMLDLFPIAGHFYDFELPEGYLWQVQKALVYVISRSIKEVDPSLRE